MTVIDPSAAWVSCKGILAVAWIPGSEHPVDDNHRVVFLLGGYSLWRIYYGSIFNLVILPLQIPVSEDIFMIDRTEEDHRR